MDICLYRSICPVNDAYAQRICDVADELGIDYNFTQITDEDILDQRDFTVLCLYAYCPGCKAVHNTTPKTDPSEIRTPVIEIDGKIALDGAPADNDALRRVLLQFAGK